MFHRKVFFFKFIFHFYHSQRQSYRQVEGVITCFVFHNAGITFHRKPNQCQKMNLLKPDFLSDICVSILMFWLYVRVQIHLHASLYVQCLAIGRFKSIVLKEIEKFQIIVFLSKMLLQNPIESRLQYYSIVKSIHADAIYFVPTSSASSLTRIVHHVIRYQCCCLKL